MEKCQRALTVAECSKIKSFLVRAQKLRYEEVLVSISRLSVFGRLYSEPARSFSYRSGDLYYLDLRDDVDPTRGELTLSLSGIVVWKMDYTVRYDANYANDISLCLKQSKSLTDPSMPVYGPNCHQASNGFLYWSSFTGGLDNFEGFERIESPEGDCVCTIKSEGGYVYR